MVGGWLTFLFIAKLSSQYRPMLLLSDSSANFDNAKVPTSSQTSANLEEVPVQSVSSDISRVSQTFRGAEGGM